VTLVFRRADAPYPVPSPGTPLRLAFVGQSTFFEACALHADGPRIATRFVEFRYGSDAAAMRHALDAFRPHAVLVFRPETIPAGAFDGMRAATVGFLTEPIPRTHGRGSHPDLHRRRTELEWLHPASFDRIVSFDPLVVPTADAFMPVWRSLPLPVDDRFFAPVRRLQRPPRLVFVGRSTPHREQMLIKAKHEFDLVHVAFGVGAGELRRLMAETDVAVNVHNEPYPSFENRVPLHLAAGHLVLSEALSPTHGLEPGIDYLEIESADDLVRYARELNAFPDSQHRVRVRGRHKAELFRASAVYPRLIGDLLADLAAFGSDRARAAA
jgi:hypothetical protein